mgnify:CR=1 FL=1
MKVIKGTNARSVTNRKARNNGMKIIFFQISSKSCVGSNFNLTTIRLLYTTTYN